MKRRTVIIEKGVARLKDYQVQKDVPLPKKTPVFAIYKFDKMEVGDSFALLENTVDERERVRAAASYYGIRHPPIKFSIRIIDPSANPKAYRCWRVS